MTSEVTSLGNGLGRGDGPRRHSGSLFVMIFVDKSAPRRQTSLLYTLHHPYPKYSSKTHPIIFFHLSLSLLLFGFPSPPVFLQELPCSSLRMFESLQCSQPAVHVMKFLYCADDVTLLFGLPACHPGHVSVEDKD